jgi:Tfp pilus assembly PilM family ATPase
MPQLLALEWDGTEARLAVASSRGDQVVIEQAFSVELRSREPGGDKSEVDIGARLAAALGARGLGRMDTLVAIGRTNIELRQLSLPPAPDDELPDLVRFQAMREFNEFDEDWLLDFVPLDDSPDQPRTVLAAAIGPDLVEQIQQTCQAAGLKPRRIVLRACAAASLLARNESSRQGELRLLIDLLSEEADLTVMADGRVVFLRTTRVGGDPPQPQVLIGEVRRTMAAVQNQLGGRKVDSIVLCGRGAQQTEMAERIEKDLAVPTAVFDPFQGLKLGGELRSAPPEHPGRFAPLIGLLLTELEHTGHAVDFLHPRRKKEEPPKWRRYVIPAVAGVLLLALYLGWQHIQHGRLYEQINDLEAQRKSWEATNEKAVKIQKVVDLIDKWAATDVCWLDVLAEGSRRFPPAEDAVLGHLILGPGPNSQGGQMTLEGFAKSLPVIEKMEQGLRDAGRRVESKNSSPDTSVKGYNLRFTGSVIVENAPATGKTAPQPKPGGPQAKTPAAAGKNAAPPARNVGGSVRNSAGPPAKGAQPAPGAAQADMKAAQATAGVASPASSDK